MPPGRVFPVSHRCKPFAGHRHSSSQHDHRQPCCSRRRSQSSSTPTDQVGRRHNRPANRRFRQHDNSSSHTHHTGDTLQQHSRGRRRWVPSHSLGRHLEGDHASTHARHGNCDHRLDAERGKSRPPTPAARTGTPPSAQLHSAGGNGLPTLYQQGCSPSHVPQQTDATGWRPSADANTGFPRVSRSGQSLSPTQKPGPPGWPQLPHPMGPPIYFCQNDNSISCAALQQTSRDTEKRSTHTVKCNQITDGDEQ